MQPQPSNNQSWRLDLSVLTIALLVFYTLGLGSYPLFTPDEGRYSEIAWEMVKSGDYITPRLNGVIFLDKPILYYWLQAFSISLFGPQEWALRLFPALFGVMGCLATYVAGRQLFDRRTGLIAAIVLATTPLYFGSAHYANLDLEVAVLISGSLFCFITGIQLTGHRRLMLLLGAYTLAALAFLTKGLIGIAFPCMIVGCWMILTRRFDTLWRSHLIKGACLAAVIITPWYYLAQRANPDFLQYFFITQQVTRFVSKTEFNNPTPGWFYLPIILIGFFPWSTAIIHTLVYAIKGAWNNRHTHSTEIFLLAWIGVIFTFFSIPHSKTVTYILPVFPPLALLTARYLSGIWEKHPTSSLKIIFITFAVISTLFACALITLTRLNFLLFPSEFKPYFYCFAAIMAAGAVIAIYHLKQPTVLKWIGMSAGTSALFLLALVLSAKQLNVKSVKPLAIELNAILQPTDEVIHYFKFYQDMPMYLNRQVMITANWNAPSMLETDNWGRDLSTGRQFGPTDSLLIDENTFWRHWDSNKRVYVFLNDNYLDQFTLRGKKYYVIGKHRETLLFSNQPPIKH